MSSEWTWVLGAAGAAAGAWVGYFRWKDRRRPEPKAWIVVAGLSGALSVVVALAGFDLLDGMRWAPSWADLSGTWSTAIPSALLIGLIEELAKFLPVFFIALATHHFDELWDGPVYAGVASVGFALAETVALAVGGELALVDGLGRALAAPISHAALAAPAGLGLAYGVLRGRYWALGLGLTVSVVAHGIYNLALAQPGWRPVGAAVVLILWLWMIWAGRDLAHRAPIARGSLTPRAR